MREELGTARFERFRLQAQGRDCFGFPCACGLGCPCRAIERGVRRARGLQFDGLARAHVVVPPPVIAFQDLEAGAGPVGSAARRVGLLREVEILAARFLGLGFERVNARVDRVQLALERGDSFRCLLPEGRLQLAVCLPFRLQHGCADEDRDDDDQQPELAGDPLDDLRDEARHRCDR